MSSCIYPLLDDQNKMLNLLKHDTEKYVHIPTDDIPDIFVTNMNEEISIWMVDFFVIACLDSKTPN